MQESCTSAQLPLRLSAIAAGAQEGDPAAVAAAAQALAGASSEAGQAEVAWICTTIAAEANRGVLAHARLMQLVAHQRERPRRTPLPGGLGAAAATSR